MDIITGRSSDTCVICRDALKRDVKNPVEILGCGHMYHSVCIEHAIDADCRPEGAQCPLCRAPIASPARLANRQNVTEDVKAARLALYFLSDIATERDIKHECEHFSVVAAEQSRFESKVRAMVQLARSTFFIRRHATVAVRRFVQLSDATMLNTLIDFLVHESQ
jgi:hypothetical protein